VNTSNRLLGILGLFTAERPVWTVEEAAKEMHVSVSTAYRYFRYLSEAGLLDPFPAGKYVLGPAIIEGDRNIRITDPLIQVGRLAMQHLVVRSGGAGVAILCRMYRKCVMCVHQEPAIIPQGGISYERGRAMPMFRGASSKVIFANLPWRVARWFFERYQAEICEAGFGPDWETVRSNLHRMRKAGVHVTHGEVDTGLVGIAAPVFRPDGNVFGSVAIAITEAEATPQSIANISALVQAAAREIDAGLRVLSHEQPSDSAVRTADQADGPSAFGGTGMARPGNPRATERT